MNAPLSNVRVLDLSRQLAGPWSAQILADFGADVIKVERPKVGDDMRHYGPPWVKGPDGKDTQECAFFLAANRNKRSVTVDISTKEGQDLIRAMVAHCDVVIENYRVGTLQRYGLGYDDLKKIKPDLIYCSVTGFGQDGPYKDRAGYDSVLQGMSGIMSITGEPDGTPGGGPQKTGMPVSDFSAGLNAAIAMLVALLHRERTGEGQFIDIALLDTSMSLLPVESLRHLLLGEVPKRMGSKSRNMVPAQAFQCADGQMILAVGTDEQFRKLMEVLGRPELGTDPRFATNRLRKQNYDALIPVLEELFKQRPAGEWVEALAARAVPCGPVNNLKQVFEDRHVQHRGLRMQMDHPTIGKVTLLGTPAKLSRTPAQYRRPPPLLGQHTQEVLREFAGIDEKQVKALADKGVV